MSDSCSEAYPYARIAKLSTSCRSDELDERHLRPGRKAARNLREDAELWIGWYHKRIMVVSNLLGDADAELARYVRLAA